MRTSISFRNQHAMISRNATWLGFQMICIDLLWVFSVRGLHLKMHSNKFHCHKMFELIKYAALRVYHVPSTEETDFFVLTHTENTLKNLPLRFVDEFPSEFSHVSSYIFRLFLFDKKKGKSFKINVNPSSLVRMRSFKINISVRRTFHLKIDRIHFLITNWSTNRNELSILNRFNSFSRQLNLNRRRKQTFSLLLLSNVHFGNVLRIFFVFQQIQTFFLSYHFTNSFRHFAIRTNEKKRKFIPTIFLVLHCSLVKKLLCIRRSYRSIDSQATLTVCLTGWWRWYTNKVLIKYLILSFVSLYCHIIFIHFSCQLFVLYE